MNGWSEHSGTAVKLLLDNIDTDQLLPARFMSQPRSAGYGDFLLFDRRRDASGELNKDFPLQRYADSSILIVGSNFGNGSSREAAVYALADAGVRVIVSSSFGDIFAANAINNGLLPAVVTTADLQHFSSVIADGDTTVTADLNTRQLSTELLSITFELDNTWAEKLRNGWDDIDLTLEHAQSISHYRQQALTERQWAWPPDLPAKQIQDVPPSPTRQSDTKTETTPERNNHE